MFHLKFKQGNFQDKVRKTTSLVTKAVYYPVTFIGTILYSAAVLLYCILLLPGKADI